MDCKGKITFIQNEKFSIKGNYYIYMETWMLYTHGNRKCLTLIAVKINAMVIKWSR